MTERFKVSGSLKINAGAVAPSNQGTLMKQKVLAKPQIKQELSARQQIRQHVEAVS